MDPTGMRRFLDADHAFTVDPVDGTKNFLHSSADHAAGTLLVAEAGGFVGGLGWRTYQPGSPTWRLLAAVDRATYDQAGPGQASGLSEWSRRA